MLIEGFLNRGAVGVLEQVLSFTEQRHAVLANNVSNFDTVGYKVLDLDAKSFYGELRRASAARDGRGGALKLQSQRGLRWDRHHRLEVKPFEVRENNILFHDQNNRFVEKQMHSMSKNALRHQVVNEMLRQEYSLLGTAIRGTVR